MPNCVHGLDARFCSICNGPSLLRGHQAARVSLSEILEFLNDDQIRATDGAVADVLGVPPRSMGAVLGDRSRDAFWVVNASTGLPTDDDRAETHPALFAKTEIISSGRELLMRMTMWRRAKK